MECISRLRLILGDQLNPSHSWFSHRDERTCYVLMEVRSETDYVRHHVQKVLGFFHAMRHFATWLESEGHRVIYIALDDPDNERSIVANLRRLASLHEVDAIEYQLPDEYRLDLELAALADSVDAKVASCDSEHFLTERGELAALFAGKKTYLMETFYRQMRKRYDVMMEDGKPISGRWNYDAENRKKLPKSQAVPAPLCFSHDVRDLLEMLEEQGVSTFGRVDAASFLWPVNREESLQLLDVFIEDGLPLFGRYQDAMHETEWSLFHSRLSFSLNVKMLHPMEVIEAAVRRWREEPEVVGIAQVEGFVRQILGWREFVRGIYWAHMPEYATLNFFGSERPLPRFYWDADTKMSCLHHAIDQSLEYAYAHHIQRLMVTGNFALLAGCSPDEVDAWYLGIYIDAIEWVELPNTRGMSQFADGGIVGSKPYVSSANYIGKMGHYCKSCHYDPKQKVGGEACPFNSLYWHFYHRNRPLLEKNPRIGLMYRQLDKMAPTKRTALLAHAELLLERIDDL